MNIIAVCKDCGSGTLNGKLNPQFEIEEVLEGTFVLCLKCGSSHVDVVSVTDDDEEPFSDEGFDRESGV